MSGRLCDADDRDVSCCRGHADPETEIDKALEHVGRPEVLLTEVLGARGRTGGRVAEIDWAYLADCITGPVVARVYGED